MKSTLKQKHSQGFTLVELAIVVAIIAILAAIAIPDYMRAQAVAKRSEGIMYLHQVKLSEINYFADYDTYSIDYAEISTYGIVPDIDDLHYYSQRLIQSDDKKLGYAYVIFGQLDNDLFKDMLILKAGNPGAIFPSAPEGITVGQDDTLL